MYLTYLRRELLGRKKQTIIVATGMALAIALVVIVSSVSNGVKDAQNKVLSSVYGVGTDITVTKSQQPSGRPSNFSFGARPSASGSGSSDSSGSSSTNISQSRLQVAMGSGTLTAAQVKKVADTSGVSAATGVLTLQNTSFSGTVRQNSGSGSSDSGSGSGSTAAPSAPSGGGGNEGGSGSSGGGFGGGSFNVNSSTITGIPVSGETVGPLTNTKVSSGRTFTSADSSKRVAVLDSSYASAQSKKVGSSVTLGGKKFTVVGIVKSTSSSSSTTSNVYIPLAVAQSISGETGKVTTIYVSASSSSGVTAVKKKLQSSLSGATVSTESELASSVSGSLSSASSLISNLGKWLSIAVLIAAFLIATLFTISGVTRRTREFGTLKAIGWPNSRITKQVAGESLVQGLIAGVIGLVVGLIGVAVINIISPSVSASVSSGTSTGAGGASGGGPGGGQGGGGQGGGGFGQSARSAASNTTDVVLHAPVTVQVLVIAIVLAVLGGLIADAFGGWRSTRLRPAEALRAVA